VKRHPSRLLVAALALSLLTACSTARDTDGKSANDKADNGKSSSAPASNGPAAPGDPAANGASGIGIDQPDPSKAIFSKQFALPGNPQRKVTVGILSLERKDRVAILKVVLTPEFADLPASELIGFQQAIDEGGAFIWQPTLLDLKNLKKYNVLHAPRTAGEGALLFQNGKAVSGQPIYGWAVFAAPPAGVTSLDLTITDWMPRLTNVPIR
jgi:hypothetical protein